MTEDLVKTMGIYYDANCILWMWHGDSYRYQTVDETDILNAAKYVLDIAKDKTIRCSKLILEGVRQSARFIEPQHLDKKYIQFKSKIYNLESQEILPADPAYFTTNPIPWDVGDSDDTPVIDEIFSEWVGKDNALILEQVAAYSIYRGYTLHRYFILNGSGRNGKGRYLEFLNRFLGEYNTVSANLHKITSNNDRWETGKLYKKLLAQMGETNYSEMKHTETLKSLTGGDKISYEFKNKQPFSDYNYAKIVISTNSLPPTTDKTIGFYSRPIIVDFNNQFNEKTDPLSRIPKYEYNNFARKCLRILKVLLTKREFHNEGSYEDKKRKYEDISNPLQKFLREKTRRDPSSHIWKWEFRDKFLMWQKENGYREWSEKQISSLMKNMFEDQKISDERTGHRWRAWTELRWHPFDASGSSVQDVRDVHQVPLTPTVYSTNSFTLDKVDKVDRKSVPPEFNNRKDEITVK